MFSLQPKQTSRLSVDIIIILFLSIGLWVFAISPLAKHDQKLNKEMLKSRILLENINREIAEHQKLAEDLARVEGGRQKIADMFPVREEMVSLVEGLEFAARNSGSEAELELTDTKLEEKILAGQLNQIDQIPFTVKLEGDYRQFTDYITYLENLPFVVHINGFSLTAESVQVTETTLQNTGKGDAELKGVLFIKGLPTKTKPEDAEPKIST